MFNLVCGELEIGFTENGGGLPDRVAIITRDNQKIPVLNSAECPLEAELGDGRVIRPAAALTGNILQYKRGETCYVEFQKIPWVDEKGDIIPDFSCSFRHEFWPDGTSFTTGFFMVEVMTPPDIHRFELKTSPDLSGFDDVRWSVLGRPKVVDGSLIQSSVPGRFMSRGQNFMQKEGIIPSACFNASQRPGISIYTEFLMEGDNTVSGNPEDNSSSITWKNNSPIISWNFQNQCRHHHKLGWQWRNQWGWIITSAPSKRRMPPLTMYHYIDKFQRWLSREQIQAIADAGCKVLILHESWRLDPQNDGMPYDPKCFKETIEEAHRAGIRVALYMRGNEDSVLEDSASWFGNYLKYNYDGLYMDYGGPFNTATPKNETYQKGRVHFRKHYLKLRKLRETVGPEGIFYSHTGPRFSALGMKLMDGYVSGEGEQGIMVRGRLEHEYFSMAFAALGTMWTAAFPEYGTSHMVPFLAATGQYPHSPLGLQNYSSSLAHPPEPGINDLAFRPLWKIWSCFSNETDLEVFNDYNCAGVFIGSSEDCGHYLMINRQHNKALLVICNFNQENNIFNVKINWQKTGFVPPDGYLLTPDMQTPGKPAKYTEEPIQLAGYGVAGILFSADGVPAEYETPYHQVGKAGQKWLAQIQEQKKLRDNPPAWSEIYLMAGIPTNKPSLPYEESLIYDIFDNQLELGFFDTENMFHSLGWIGKERFITDGKQEKEDQLWRGENSIPIPLHHHLKPGLYRLAVRTWHGDEPFYSFIEVTLAPTPDMKNGYKLKFYSDIEPDRAYLNWKSLLI